MTTPPRWYRVVSVLALLWMLFGVAALLQDAFGSEAMRATMSDAQRQLYDARPRWLFLCYAVAIFAGLAGAVALLLRRRWAVPVLVLSLAAAVVQFGYTFVGMRAIELLGPAIALPFPLVILAIGAALVGVARHAEQAGWLGSRVPMA